MKINYFLFFFYLLLGLSVHSQIPPTIQWEQNFGGSNIDKAAAIRTVSGGGYIVAGWTESTDGDVSGSIGGGRKAWVVRLDAQGNLLWEKAYQRNGTTATQAMDIRTTTDGGFIAAGYATFPPRDQTDFWILKLDAQGNQLWEYTYGGSLSEYAYTVQQTNDGGYIVAGESSSDNGDVGQHLGSRDAWVVKLDGAGNIVWEETYGGSSGEGASDIQQTTDGGYIVAGSSNSNNGDLPQNQGGLDAWIFKITATGGLSWSKSYGGSGHDHFGVSLFVTDNDALRQTSDGGYIVVGRTQSNDGDIGQYYGVVDAWVVKLDASGNLVWENTYGGTSAEGASAVWETPEGDFVIGGTMSTTFLFASDYWIFKIDSTGALLWQQTFGGTGPNQTSGFDNLHGLLRISGCEYIMAGFSNSNNGDVGGNKGKEDMWVVKLIMQWPAPLVTSPQSFCWSDNATLADLGAIGNGAPSGFPPTFTWYDDSLKTTTLPDTTVLADGKNYFVSQTIDGCESPLAEVLVNLDDPIPVAASPQEFCEGNNALLSNLVVTGRNLTWYADVGGQTSLPDTTPLQDGETYYVSQTLNACESSLLPIEVLVHALPVATASPPFYQCDVDNDGFAEFPLSDLNNIITSGAPDVAVSYHKTFASAEQGTLILPDPYTNEQSPEQTVYARVENTVTGCYSIVEVQLVISPVPEIAGLKDLSGCDNGNGEAIFDLTQNNNDILDGQNGNGLDISYHESQLYAKSGQNAIPNPENYTSGPKTIFVRLENEQTGCFDTGSFELSISPRPNIANSSIQEEVCSDLQGGNVATIDLTIYNNQINPGNPASTSVVYYANANEHAAGNSIKHPESYTTTSNPQTIVAEVVDTTTGCPSLEQVEITITVNDRPLVNLSSYESMALCWDSDPSTPVQGGNYQPIVLKTGLNANAYTFEWSLDDKKLSETGPSLGVVEPGVYEVLIVDTDGSATTCTSTASATIIQANPPEFDLSRTSKAVANEHGILVSNISGVGNFAFRLDDGPWLALGNDGTLLFEKVAPGTHLVYGRSLEGCGTTLHTITLIGYPKFFTPNNDGQNDRWNIIGLKEQPQSKILIFDRYGKLLESLNPAAPGWDGTYNSRRMPSNDYWFQVGFVETLPDGTEQKQEFVGHFSLVR